MSKTLKKYLQIIGVILVIIFLLQKINCLPSLRNIFKSKPLIIDSTPILITEINNLAQLITITYYSEVVLDSIKIHKRLPGQITAFPPSKIALIAKGKVLAGVDLKKVKAEDISIVKDSIHIILPAAQIIYTVLNPSDFETFDETGYWSSEEVTQIKIRIREKIIKEATEQNIISKSDKRCQLIIENFLRNTGFKKIEIINQDHSP